MYRKSILLATLVCVAACGQSPTAPAQSKSPTTHPSADGTAPADSANRSGIGFGGGH
jgi:hypothetical protein